jgi:transcription initiation factor TFIID subunit 9B
MDFAYRYTAGILNDAVHIRDEGYDQPPSATGKRKKDLNAGQSAEDGDLSLNCLRIAIASRQVAETGGRSAVNKEFLKGIAEERNRIGLNVGTQHAGMVTGGVRLPEDKYTLTGVGWGLKEEWESEGEEDVPVQANGIGGEDVDMGMDGAADEEVEGMDEEGEGNMEDVFGADDGDGLGGGDLDMEDS